MIAHTWVGESPTKPLLAHNFYCTLVSLLNKTLNPEHNGPDPWWVVAPVFYAISKQDGTLAALNGPLFRG